MKIRDIEIKNKYMLAPMAGECDYAFRRICKEMGAGLIYTEMVSDKAVYYRNEKTLKMLEVFDDEKPVSLQIFGSDVSSFVEAAKYIDEHSNCDIIDINMGCPVTKVAKKAQAGSALLKDVNKIYEIVSAVVQAVSKPVTVKIRSGWDEDSINAVEVAQTIEKAGASAIAIHGRTRSQMYRGFANYDVIKDVVNAVSIPVFGNGDVVDIQTAQHMLNYTGCAGVMIGRGVLGNPWLFRDLIAYENGLEVSEVSVNERIDMILKHLKYLIELKGENLACREMRAHAHHYLKKVPNTSSIKQQLNSFLTYQEYEDTLLTLKNKLN